jgi:hypothetical protein
VVAEREEGGKAAMLAAACGHRRRDRTGRAGGVARRPAGTSGAGSICFCVGSIWFWRGSHRFGVEERSPL